ncbi:TonB-dependent receptor plug domain-containing protein [Steroidobacter sp.]|uniref:TonB-dependent receptor plug domain-containing protein n=1 Tax=Steroidobacter sp. TaxID=1978227 RepID=UPI001A4B9C54|nr:TonB-dependent receptor [Steroidobacter sp.]MBL8264729.1 TonB-dependent receptor [Steroidobacter sp.]
MHALRWPLLTVLCLTALPPAVWADEEEEESIDTIVVTGTRSGNLVRDEPIRVEVLPEEEIEENLTVQPGNLSTLLSELGGLHIQSTAPGLGGATLRMRGLSGRHTLVLQDGLPLLGAQTDAFGLLQTPPLDLARVEVIKGVGSALYGGSALGGVLNLASRAPGGESEMLLNRSSRGATDVVGFFSGPPIAGLGYTLIAGAHDQSREDLNSDAWADLAGYRRYTLRPRVFWEGDAGQSVFATVGFVDEDRYGGTMPRRTLADGSAFRDSLQTRRIDGGMTMHFNITGDHALDTRWSATRLERERDFAAQRVEDRQTTAFAEGTLSGHSQGHKWLAGLAVQYEQLRSVDAPDAQFRYVVPAIFAQDEFSPSDLLTLSASARIDDHNEYGTFFSPRLSALLRPQPDWTVRASIGSGFAAPTPVMEEIEATSLLALLPVDEARAEKAMSYSVDVQWQEDNWEINGSLFGSQIREPLTIRSALQPGRLELINADGPRRVLGAELLVRYVNGLLHVIGSSTYLDVTEAAPGGGRRDSDLIPEFAAELVALIEDEDRGRIGVEVSYTGRQRLFDNPYRSVGRPYFEISALAQIKLGRVAVFLNAINLTNVRQTNFDPLLLVTPSATGERITDVWAPLAGRTFNLGVKLEL